MAGGSALFLLGLYQIFKKRHQWSTIDVKWSTIDVKRIRELLQLTKHPNFEDSEVDRTSGYTLAFNNKAGLISNIHLVVIHQELQASNDQMITAVEKFQQIIKFVKNSIDTIPEQTFKSQWMGMIFGYTPKST